MSVNGSQRKQRRKCSKPVPLRDLQCDETDDNTVPIATAEQLKNAQLPGKAEKTISSAAETAPNTVTISMTIPVTSPAEVVKSSPRHVVVKKEILVGNEASDAVHTPSENRSISVPSSGKANSRKRTKKRLPFSDSTKSQAAKRNRLSEAASQVHFHEKQEAASKDVSKDNKPKIDTSMRSEKPVRRKRRPKNEADIGVETKTRRSSGEPQAVSTKEADSRRAKIQKVMNEVLNIVQFPKNDKLSQALDDVLIDGVPLAVSAAQRGFPEFYLRTFIQAITIHIRQTCPELL